MSDPGSRIHPEILQHLHLLLNVPLPRPQSKPEGLPIDKVIEILLQAVKYIRSEKTVSWQLLDGPPDGTLLVTWQSPRKTGFASDGYIYADPERAFSQQARGYTVEMYIQRAGFRIGERYTSHCRKRFRVKNCNPPMPQDPNLPPPDENLWLVQYARLDNPQDRIPTEKIPITRDILVSEGERAKIRQNELMRKEFMFHDRENWPLISLPEAPNPGGRQQGITHQHTIEASLGKRQRPMGAGAGAGAGAVASLGSEKNLNIRSHFEEEDSTIGDVMDYLTPREISHARFTQHAEWMEEIFSSPYETGSIVPSELGLGRKGELESLTGAFFDAPMQVRSTSAGPVGKMENEKADSFRRSVRESLARIDADIKEMKRKHAQDIAEIQKGSPVKQCLQQLQQIPVHSGQDQALSAVVNKFETSMNKKIHIVDKSKCIQKGGLQEKTLQDQRAARFLDQKNLVPPSGPETLLDFSQGPSAQENQVLAATLPSTTHADQTRSGITSQPMAGDDVDTESDQNSAQGPEAPQEDWVIVGRDDNAGQQTDVVAQNPSAPTTFEEAPPADPSTGDDGLPTDQEVSDFPADAVPETGGAFDTTTFDDNVDFGNLDTAGDALAGFTPGDADLSLGEHGDMGLEDSAFGDAYHADPGTSPGEDPDMPGSEMQQ